MPNSVAVLPFENASEDADDTYLSEGLSDELRDQLGRVTELRLAARSSSVAALERGMDAIEVSDNLRVAHILEGSMRRQGNRLRVSVQLIEGRNGLAIWSETYQRSASELLVVQQTIADEIVSRILPKAEDVVTTPATRDADANELMLLARHYERQVRERQVRDDETLLDAIRLYRGQRRPTPSPRLRTAGWPAPCYSSVISMPRRRPSGPRSYSMRSSPRSRTRSANSTGRAEIRNLAPRLEEPLN